MTLSAFIRQYDYYSMPPRAYCCPCKCSRKRTWDEFRMISHLETYHKWSPEQIADWLEQQGL